MFLHRTPIRSRHASAGFSMVEIMIGMVIGMLGIIVMMQVFSLAEGQKRTSLGGNDAQNNGAIALYGLQRDIRQAGYGISALQLMGCNVQLPTGVTLNAMAPVTINHASIPAGDANTDTLMVVYGNGNGAPEGDTISTQPAADTYAVATPTSFVAGDRVIAQPPTTTPRAAACNLVLTTVATVGVANASNVAVAAGTGVAGANNGTLFNLGATPRILVYAIRGGNLTQCDLMVNDCTASVNVANPLIWIPIGSNIVSLRAQYGRDTTTVAADYSVNLYDQITPTTDCGWTRTLSIRLALVSRSEQPDADVVTAASPAWMGSVTGNPTGSAATPIDLSGNASWQRYRYRTFQTVAPIRNVAWKGVQAGC